MVGTPEIVVVDPAVVMVTLARSNLRCNGPWEISTNCNRPYGMASYLLPRRGSVSHRIVLPAVDAHLNGVTISRPMSRPMPTPLADMTTRAEIRVTYEDGCGDQKQATDQAHGRDR